LAAEKISAKFWLGLTLGDQELVGGGPGAHSCRAGARDLGAHKGGGRGGGGGGGDGVGDVRFEMQKRKGGKEKTIAARDPTPQGNK